MIYKSFLTITESHQQQDELELNLAGDKDFIINCIALLIRTYFDL